MQDANTIMYFFNFVLDRFSLIITAMLSIYVALRAFKYFMSLFGGQ